MLIRPDSSKTKEYLFIYLLLVLFRFHSFARIDIFGLKKNQTMHNNNHITIRIIVDLSNDIFNSNECDELDKNIQIEFTFV